VAREGGKSYEKIRRHVGNAHTEREEREGKRARCDDNRMNQ